MEGKKVFAYYAAENRLISKMYKELKQVNGEKTTQLMSKHYLFLRERQFSKEDTND
jgi:hypothetical protein